MKNSIMNSFVLFVVALTFLKGFVIGRKSYGLVASMISVVFAVLMTLVFLTAKTFSYGIFGYAALPVLIRRITTVKTF